MATFSEPGLKLDEKSIENSLEVQHFLVKCLSGVVATTLIVKEGLNSRVKTPSVASLFELTITDVSYKNGQVDCKTVYYLGVDVRNSTTSQRIVSSNSL